MGFLDILKKIPSENELTGSFGERLTELFSKTMTDVFVLRDVLIDTEKGNTSQTDLILIDGTGIYVIEVKTFSEAKIYGDFNKTTWYYYNHGHKYELYSPVKQNAKHIEHLKNMLKDFGDLPFFSCVAMLCEDFKISGEADGKTLICNSLPAMRKGLCMLSAQNPVVLDEQKKQEIYNFIRNNQTAGQEARDEHKKNVIAYKRELQNMKEQKICPYCKCELVLRNGKNGEFYGCKNFPRCRYTLSK